MAKTRQPGDLFKAFQAKKQKSSVKKKSSGSSMEGMDSLKYYTPQPKATVAKPMATRVSGIAKPTTTLPGTGSVSRVQSGPWSGPGIKLKKKSSGKKRKASKLDMAAAFKKKSACKCKGACKCAVKKKSASK